MVQNSVVNDTALMTTTGKAATNEAEPKPAPNDEARLVVVIATLSIIIAALVFPGAVLVCTCRIRQLRTQEHEVERCTRKCLNRLGKGACFSRSGLVNSDFILLRDLMQAQ